MSWTSINTKQTLTRGTSTATKNVLPRSSHDAHGVNVPYQRRHVVGDRCDRVQMWAVDTDRAMMKECGC